MNYETPSSKTIFESWESQKEKRERSRKLFKEIVVENFLSWQRCRHPGTKSPNRLNPKRTSWRHVIIKLLKIRERNSAAAKRRNSLPTSEPSRGYQHITQQKFCRPVDSEIVYSKPWKKKKYCQPRTLDKAVLHIKER